MRIVELVIDVREWDGKVPEVADIIRRVSNRTLSGRSSLAGLFTIRPAQTPQLTMRRDDSFNSITGLNGSGKSNILDAICFVLGITKLDTVRAQNMQVSRIGHDVGRGGIDHDL